MMLEKIQRNQLFTGMTSRAALLVFAVSSILLNVNISREIGDPVPGTNNLRVVHLKDDTGPDFRPRNLRLAFLGDSVTRYQYISLVYFLMHGRWLRDDEHPSLLFKKEFPTWQHFLNASNFALLEKEECDCYTPPGKFAMASYAENRYYKDEELGNYITFINKYGRRPAQGHWLPNQVYEPRGVLSYTGPFQNFTWEYNWTEVIDHHIAKLQPTPDFLVFNAGLHPNELNQPWVIEGIKESLRRHNITPIYKTTTYPASNNRNTRFQRGRKDWNICGKSIEHCMNMMWTADITGQEHYVDENHFRPSGNKRMNLQLLDLLTNITTNSTA